MQLRFRGIAIALLCTVARSAQNGPPPAEQHTRSPLSHYRRLRRPRRIITKKRAWLNSKARSGCRESSGDDGHLPGALKVIEHFGAGPGRSKALEGNYARGIRTARDLAETVAVQIAYHLPTKSSRWHLLHAEFQPPDGASRPIFANTVYPSGAGILTGAAVDEGRLLGAIGRQAFATIAFTIDERGVPGNFRAEDVSETMWGPEAILLLHDWRFRPGTKDGRPVAVPAKFQVAWGPLDLSPERISRIREALDGLEALEIFVARMNT